ncbi:MAG: hypothetical protein H7328_10990 [Bdellovibrio sp.]|nr:hypothetical protein [Bdellovibrio sp.]
MNQVFSLPADKMSELSYGVLAEKIFIPKCISCHGNAGNINFESYGEVVRNLALIKKTVFIEKTMPKKGSLSQEELSYLWNWINMGAPEQAQNGNSNPQPDPLIATYESINKHVFQVSCKDCHNPTGSGKRVPLDKESLLNSPLELIIPGNPDESGLVIDLERTDDKRMPPAKEGYSALSDEAKATIRKWIENGAKD